MLPFTVENVYIFVKAFHGENAEERTTSEQWLKKFQKSVDAWIITNTILTELSDYNATFFAAQTIRQKILYDFSELSSDLTTCVALRTSMMNHIHMAEMKFPQYMPIVMQLAIGLADLYLQMPQWNNFIGEIQVSNLSTYALLAMFTVFPEELYNHHLRIGSNRRCAVELELVEKTEVVLQSLGHLCEISPGDTTIQKKVISCLATWLLNKQCPKQLIAESPFFQSVLYAVRLPNCEDSVLDAATECITNALFLIEDLTTSEQLAQVMQAGIYECLDAVRENIVKEDVNKLQNYTRMFCELCESLMPKIVEEPGVGFGDLRTLELILLVIDYHDYSLAEMTLNVWYRLSEYLFQADDSDFDVLRVVFRPYIERLIISLYKHCRLERDMIGIMNPDSDIAQFRKKASESIKDVTFIIGSVDLIKCMTNLASSSLASGSWEEVESAIFVMSCIIHNVVETENEVIPVLLKMILNFQLDTHVMLLNTSAVLLGNLSDWLLANSKYISYVAQWLISLASSSIALLKTMAWALEQICDKGYNHLYQCFDVIYEITLNIENVPTNGQQMEAASHHLMRACAYLVNDLSAAEITNRLQRLCSRPVKFLSEIVAGQVIDNVQDKENMLDNWRRLSSDPMLWLDRLSGVYRVLKPWPQQYDFRQQKSELNGNNSVETPWLALSVQIWRVLSTTLEHFKSKVRVVEHTCRTIRFLIRSIGAEAIVFVGELAQQIITIYEEYPHSCFLYLASILADEYGNNAEQIQDGLIVMLNHLSLRSIILLQSENGSREFPDTVDDLYRLAARFVQRLPNKFFVTPVFETLFNGAIAGLEVDHMDANRSVTKFILSVIDVARRDRKSVSDSCVADAEKILLKSGPQLVWRTLNASAFHLSSALLKEMSEILHAISVYNKERLEEWLSFGIMNLPQNSGFSATTEQLNEFRLSVLRCEKQYDVLACLKVLCKYYS